MDYWDAGLRDAVRALIPEVEGRPCVNVGEYDGGVYVCRRISGLHADEDSFNGQCEWVDPEAARPGELTDGMSISCDCVRLGPGWWQDAYFGWYFVYDPGLVARSLAVDHAWVKPFLGSDPRPTAAPAPAPKPPPGPSQRLRPKAGRPHLRPEDVVARLDGAFAFFAAHPHGSPNDLGVAAAGPAGPGRAFSVVLADDPDTTDHVSFEVRPGADIRLGYRDERHQAATLVLVERCARLLDYEVFAP